MRLKLQRPLSFRPKKKKIHRRKTYIITLGTWSTDIAFVFVGWFLETDWLGTCHIALAALELDLQTRVASNLW